MIIRARDILSQRKRYRDILNNMHTLGAALPEYRTKALIVGCSSGNLIHTDEQARRYGYRAGLVTGSSLYAYLSRTAVEYLGRNWLENGTAEVRFIHPVYDGEEIRISGTAIPAGESEPVHLQLEGTNSQGITCLLGCADLNPQAQMPEPILETYPAGDIPTRVPILLESLQLGTWLKPVCTKFTWNIHWEYCQKTVHDHHPIYQQMVHPGWLLMQANNFFAENFIVDTWLQVSNVMQHYHVLESECMVETRGRIVDKFEHKGNHYVCLDLAIFADRLCLQTIRHTVIFHLAPRAA
jgi:hypothetical protein